MKTGDSQYLADPATESGAQHVVSVRTNLVVFGILVLLVAVTLSAAWMPLGRWGSVVALTIASIKTVIIGMYFMHLRWSDSFVRVIAVAALFWLLLLMSLTLSDFSHRRGDGASPGASPGSVRP